MSDADSLVCAIARGQARQVLYPPTHRVGSAGSFHSTAVATPTTGPASTDTRTLSRSSCAYRGVTTALRLKPDVLDSRSHTGYLRLSARTAILCAKKYKDGLRSIVGQDSVTRISDVLIGPRQLRAFGDAVVRTPSQETLSPCCYTAYGSISVPRKSVKLSRKSAPHLSEVIHLGTSD